MDDYIKIGKNIRYLRTAFGETQEELGRAIHVTKSAVSNYERGDRQPKEVLIVIAEHFDMTFDEFCNLDFSKLGKISIDPTYAWKYIHLLLPIAYSEKAFENEKFQKAFETHQKGFTLLNKQDYSGLPIVIESMEYYADAYEDERAKTESAANIIGIHYLVLLCFKSVISVKSNTSAVIVHVKSRDSKIKKIINNIEPDLEKDAKDILSDFQSPEWINYIEDLLRVIKRSKLWSDLADYYLALPYVWHLVENELSDAYNQRIGMEMLEVLTTVGNQYAMSFMAFATESLYQ